MKNSTRQYICGIFFLLVFPFFIHAQPLPPNVPPIAEFTYTLSGGSEINFDATESFDMDGTIVSWTWNFGDGTTGSGQTTSHTYTYGNTYTVTLTVTDNQGATGTQSQNVTPDIANAPPTAQFTSTPTGVYRIDFNASTSSDPDGTIVSWTWNFGDGTTGSGQTVSHTYANGNTYNVTLTVTDNDGATGTLSQSVTPINTNVPPIAQFTTTPTGIYVIDFNAAASNDPDGTIVSWAWNFGDGTSGSGQTVSHTYANGNTYNVTLTVTDNNGATAMVTQQVTPVDMTVEQTVQVGYTTVFPTNAVATTRRAEQITIPNAGQIKSLSIYHHGGSSSIILGVYSDNADRPGTRLGVTPITTVNSTQGWQEVTLESPVPVVSGQKVWLAWLTQSNLVVRMGTGSPGRIDSGQPWAGGMPVNFGNGSISGAVFSLYANVIVQGGTNQPPVASFTSNTLSNYAVNFNASASSDPDGTIVGWSWNFGDGQTGTGQTVSHTYANGNTYLVTLTVTDNNGATGTLSQNVTPTNINTPPTAQFTFTPTGVYGINFDGTGSSDPDGTIVSWSWNFGNGQTGTGQTVTHTYANGNTYTVTLTVTDNSGAMATSTQQVTPVDMTGGPTVQVGYTTVFPTNAVATTRRAEQITIPDAGQIKSLSIYHHGGTSNIILGVYADNAERPGARLGVTAITQVNNTQGWQEVVLESPVPVVAGQKVWLAWLTQSNLIVRMGTGSPGRIDSGQSWAGGMPVNFGNGSISGAVFSLYANVIVQGGTNQPPVASFTSTSFGNYGIDFNATASSDPDGTIVSWAWNFGDGTTGNGQTVSHTYPNGSTYNVTLTVTDNNGATATSTQQVTPLDMTGGPTVQVGYTTVFPTNAVATTRRAEQITMPNSGTIMSLSIYHHGGTSNIILGVYADNAERPGARLGVTAITQVNNTQGWQEVVLESPVPVVAGQKVWLAWLTQSNLIVRMGTGSPGRIDSGQSWAGGMPVNFGNGSISGAVFSLYANVVLPGGNTRESDIAFSGNEFKEVDPNQISVYPNPFNNHVNVELQVIEENTLVQMALIDLNGRSIGIPINDRFEKGLHTISLHPLDIGKMKPGVYILKVELNEKVFNRRIIRQ